MLKIAQYYEDFIKNLTEPEKEEIFREGEAIEAKNIKYIRQQYEGRTDYQDIVKEDKTIEVKLKRYIAKMRLALVIVFATREISEKKRRNLNNIYSIISKDAEKTFKNLIRDYLQPLSKTEGSITKLHGLWLDNPPKEVVETIGKMSLHYAGYSYTEQEKAKIKEALIKAEALMSQTPIPHFKEAFYGDVIILDEEASSSASYHKPTDIIWIRKGILKSNSIELMTHILIHELGHRYYKKVLNQKQKDNWGELFKILDTMKNNKLPQIGDSLFFDWNIEKRGLTPGKDIIVSEDTDKNGLPVYIAQNRDSGRTATVSLMTIMKKNNMFPSDYSQESPEEFFCETISLYVSGKMRKSIRDLLTHLFEHNFLIIENDSDSKEMLTEKDVYKYYTPISEAKAKEYLAASEHMMHAKDTQITEIAKKFHSLLKSYEGLDEPWFIPKDLLHKFLSIMEKADV